MDVRRYSEINTMKDTTNLIPPNNRLNMKVYLCAALFFKFLAFNSKKLLIEFAILIVMLLSPTISLADQQASLFFECNEITSTIGVGESIANFDSNKLEGWQAKSVDSKYRIWSVPMYGTDSTYEWSCKIQGKKAEIKIWSQITPKDELIDKYGAQHEKCGAFRKLRFTYDKKIILQDILMKSDDCDENSQPVLRTLYFSKLNKIKKKWNNLLSNPFELSGNGLSKNHDNTRYSILINGNGNNFGVYQILDIDNSRELKLEKLPVTSKLFDQFLNIKK